MIKGENREGNLKILGINSFPSFGPSMKSECTRKSHVSCQIIVFVVVSFYRRFIFVEETGHDSHEILYVRYVVVLNDMVQKLPLYFFKRSFTASTTQRTLVTHLVKLASKEVCCFFDLLVNGDLSVINAQSFRKSNASRKPRSTTRYCLLL